MKYSEEYRGYHGEDGILRVPLLPEYLSGDEDLIQEFVNDELTGLPVNLSELDSDNSNLVNNGTYLTLKQRSDIIREYWSHRKKNLQSNSNQSIGDKDNILDVADTIVEELLNEADKLLGNEAVAASRDDIQTSTIISSKRSDTLVAASKALDRRHRLSKELDLDVEHPQMELVFRYFLGKVSTSLRKVGAEDEFGRMLFAFLGKELVEWKEDLKVKIRTLGKDDGEKNQNGLEVSVIKDG